MLPKFDKDDALESLKLLYTTQRLNSSGMRQFRLHEMQFFSDFVEILRDLGKMPKVTLKEVKLLTDRKREAEEKKRNQIEQLKILLQDPAKRQVLEARPEFQELLKDKMFAEAVGQ